MLTKLLKYEAKTTARMLLPVYAGMVLAWFVTKSIDRLCTVLGLQQTFWAELTGGIFELLFGLMLLVTFVMTLFVAVRQFYRLLGEDGYLLFTLPASPAQHMAAKLLCATGWFCVLFVTMQVLSGSISTGNFESSGVIEVGNWTLDASLPFTFAQRLALDGAVWVLTILGTACGYLFMYLCMAIGMHWPNKRLFASVACYLAISFVCQITLVLSLVGIGYYFYTNDTAFLAMQTWLGELGLGNFMVLTTDKLFTLLLMVMGISFLLLLAANAILWFITHHLLSKKLNIV